MVWLLVSLMSFTSLTTAASSAVNPNPLKAEAGIRPSQLAPGTTAELFVRLELAKDHHAYLDQFQLQVDSPKELRLGRWTVTPLIEFQDKFTKKRRQGIEGQAIMKAALEIPENFPEGKSQAQLLLTYQACGIDYCLLPKTIPVPVELTVISSTEGLDRSFDREDLQSKFERALRESSWLVFLFVFLGGLLTSFTPCIFPMIPITLAILGAQGGKRHSALTGFKISSVYVGGIGLTYATLGLIAASTGSLFGSLLGQPLAVGMISGIFFLMSLSLYGFYELQVPAFVEKRLRVKKWAGTYSGAFLSGVVAGLVASPCVGPVLIAVLTYVAKSQNLLFGFSLLFVYALGLGLIFIVLGTFSQVLHWLPRSGPWLNGIKFVSGSLMLAMAFYFARPLLPPVIFKILVGLTLVIVSLAAGALNRAKPLLTRVLLSSLGATGALLFLDAAIVSPPPAQEPLRSAIRWTPFSDLVLADAQRQKRPVIIDFYADWCASCKDLEERTFSDHDVQRATEDFVWVQFDATKSSPELQVLQDRYEILGLPFVIFYDREGKWQKDLTLTGFETAEEFLKRIQRLKGHQ